MARLNKKRTESFPGRCAAALAFLAAFVFFQFAYPYHLIRREQMTLFVYDWDYIFQTYRGSGWLARLASDFIEQFFLGRLGNSRLVVYSAPILYRESGGVEQSHANTIFLNKDRRHLLFEVFAIAQWGDSCLCEMLCRSLKPTSALIIGVVVSHCRVCYANRLQVLCPTSISTKDILLIDR